MGKKTLIYLTPIGALFGIVATMNSRILREELLYDLALKIPRVIEVGLIFVAVVAIAIAIFVEKNSNPAVVVFAVVSAIVLYGIAEQVTSTMDSVGLWTAGIVAIIFIIMYYVAILGATASTVFYALVGTAGSMELYMYLYTWLKTTPDDDLHYIRNVPMEYFIGLVIIWIMALIVEMRIQQLSMLKNILTLMLFGYATFIICIVLPMIILKATFFMVPMACIGYVIGEVCGMLAY